LPNANRAAKLTRSFLAPFDGAAASAKIEAAILEAGMEPGQSYGGTPE